MKNSFKLLLVVLIWLGMPACCPNYWRATDMQISFFEDSVGFFTSGQVESDSVVMEVQIVSEEYSCNWNFLANSAYALQCDSYLKHGYAAIEVLSNSDYNGIPAGQPLNEKLSWEGFPIDSVLSRELMAGASKRYDATSFFLTFKEKPAVPKHKFTIKLTDDTGGTVTSTESGELEWL